MIFLTTEIVKFMMGIGTFAAGLQQEFAGKLPTSITLRCRFKLLN